MPIPNATVATTTLNGELVLENDLSIDDFNFGVLQAVNMSTRLNLANPIGSVISSSSTSLTFFSSECQD